VLEELGRSEEAEDLLRHAVELSKVVASEDPALQLHAVLNSEELQAIVQQIGSAAYRLLPNGDHQEQAEQ
jgi:hypothetical protein